jgi:hypothetical protein
MLSFGAAQLPTAVLPEDDLTNRGDRFCFVHLSIDALSAFSFPSFACSIAGVASGLPLFFHGGFPRGPLSEFHIAGLLLGFQGGLTSGSLGGLCGGQGSSLLSFNANLVAVRSAIRASRATLTASRAERRSTAAGLSAADLARAARSSWAFFAFAAALRRSAKSVFLGPFISILYAQGKAAQRVGWLSN